MAGYHAAHVEPVNGVVVHEGPIAARYLPPGFFDGIVEEEPLVELVRTVSFGVWSWLCFFL